MSKLCSRNANSVNPDPLEQSDHGLHCLPRPVCLNISVHDRLTVNYVL